MSDHQSRAKRRDDDDKSAESSSGGRGDLLLALPNEILFQIGELLPLKDLVTHLKKQ